MGDPVEPAHQDLTEAAGLLDLPERRLRQLLARRTRQASRAVQPWAAPFLGRGKTWLYEKIRSGEIVSKLEGRVRLIHVPSLIARYGLPEDQIVSGHINSPMPDREIARDFKAAAPTVKTHAHKRR